MIEKETYRLDSKTPVGSAMIQQAASALYFILGVAIFLVRYPVQDIIIITIAASL